MVVVDGGYGGCWWLVCFIGVVERVDNRATSESYLSLIEKDIRSSRYLRKLVSLPLAFFSCFRRSLFNLEKRREGKKRKRQEKREKDSFHMSCSVG